ncbi:unnamed protein product [Adineta steineri]|uniref:TIR domain-containing protein n=1 Tax=Adineta steineri TaxID=433720 RepID=A0A815FFZ2_9BILA|nr:unnamed protein product [Adineta steineri]CAF1588193.1 unnamed protein product [Adineta steineri]
MENNTTCAERNILKRVKLDIDQLIITNASLQDEHLVKYVMSTVYHDLKNLIEDDIAQSDLAGKAMQIICQGLGNGYKKSIHQSIERHEFWQVFHKTFSFIFENTCRINYALTENNGKTFKSMCFLMNCLKPSQGKTHQIVQKCLFTDHFIEMFRKCLILVSEDSSLTIRCIVLKETLHCFCLHISSQMREQIQSQIFEPCLRCLLSKLYIESFDHLDKESAVFFTETCPSYTSTYCINQYEQIATQLHEPFLKHWPYIYQKWFPALLHDQSEKLEIRNYKRTSNAFIRYLEILTICASIKTPRDQFPNSIIKDLLDIIISSTKIETDKNGQKLFSITDKSHTYMVLVLLYNLSLNTRLASVLKDIMQDDKAKRDYNETILFLCRYKDRTQDETNVEKKKRNEEKIQFLAKNLFALTIDNIDNLQQPEDLASKYAIYLTNMVENSTQTHCGIHLRSLLQAMRIIIQNRHMRNGLVKESGLPSLTKSACHEKFDGETIQQLALDLIWTTSFDSKAAKSCKIDKKFVEKLKFFLQSNIPEIKSSADGILWRVEGEADFQLRKASERGTSVDHDANLAMNIEEDHTQVYVWVEINGMRLSKLRESLTREELEQIQEKRIKEENIEKQNVPRYDYDIMISYSHDNADMCHLIHECLIKTGKYQVWIDKNKMYGSLMERMAEAIEQSETILICASSEYKTSQACRSEAEYAYKKKRRMIFIKVEQKYTPNGWLGLLFGNTYYTDFIKSDFSKAFKDLYEQLHRHRKDTNPDYSILDKILTREVLDKASDIVQKMKEKKQQTTGSPSSNTSSCVPVISNTVNTSNTNTDSITDTKNSNTPEKPTNRLNTPLVIEETLANLSTDSKFTIKDSKVHIDKNSSKLMNKPSETVDHALKPESSPRSAKTTSRSSNNNPVVFGIYPKRALPPIVSPRTPASFSKICDNTPTYSKLSQPIDHSDIPMNISRSENHDDSDSISSYLNVGTDIDDISSVDNILNLSPMSTSLNEDYESDFESEQETNSEDDTFSDETEDCYQKKTVDQWSQREVLKFLLEKKLTSVLQLFGNDTINGQRLQELYSIIIPKSTESLNKLRDMLNSSQTITMPADDLERFQEELKKLIPKTSCNESVVCEIM